MASVEERVIEYLNNQLKPTPCYAEYPEEEKKAPFICIERTGQSITNHVARTTLAIQCISSTMLGAIELSETAKRTLYGMEEDENVSMIFRNSYNHTDPTSKFYRYQLIFEVITIE